MRKGESTKSFEMISILLGSIEYVKTKIEKTEKSKLKWNHQTFLFFLI